MKRLAYLVTLVLAVIFFLSFSVTQSLAGKRTYRMFGEITAIDLAYNTVVVEVPLEGKMATVGGPLASDAVLKKAGQPVGLTGFQIGDEVWVKWKLTEQGHRILSLKAE